MGVVNAAGKQTIGQMSEVIFMLVMPFFFVRLGVKKMLLVGMLAWAARYLLFAFGRTDLGSMYYLGIALHGICYDFFFFVTGQIYVDKTAPRAIQAERAGLHHAGHLRRRHADRRLGVGARRRHVRAQRPGARSDRGSASRPSAHDWRAIWLWPAAMAVGIILLFALFFREESPRGVPAEGGLAALET